MSALSKTLRLASGNRIHFWCPGCDKCHSLPFGEGAGPRWTWNGDIDKPTFTPSLLVSWYHGDPDKGTKVDFVCHSFIREGQIQFLGDCTHHLKGQTVDIPEWPRPEWKD